MRRETSFLRLIEPLPQSLKQFYDPRNVDFDIAENANRGGFQFRHWAKYKQWVAERSISKDVESWYSKEVVEAHSEKLMHAHDFSYASIYCYGWPTWFIATNGLPSHYPKVRPPKHFASFVRQLIDFTFLAQLEVAGAVGLGPVTAYMAPFAKHDLRSGYMQWEAIANLIEGIPYALCEYLRPGAESPFSNFLEPLSVDNYAQFEVPQLGLTIGESEDEYWRVVKAIVDTLTCGDAEGNPFTFPIVTLQIGKWINDIPDDVLQSLQECLARRGAFYFQSCWNRDPKEVNSFCCRLTLDFTRVPKEYSEIAKRMLRDMLDDAWARGFFGVSAGGTGSVGVASVNLAGIAMRTKDETLFEEQLLDVLTIASQYVIQREALVRRLYELNAYPMFKAMHGRFETLFRTFGCFGGFEAALALGYRFATKADLRDFVRFAKRTMKLVLEFASECINTYGRLFNVEKVPGESARVKSYMKDYEKFHREFEWLFVYGEEGAYTPGFDIPDWLAYELQLTLNERVKLMRDIEWMWTGGTVVHVNIFEYGQPEVMWKLAIKLTKELPYVSLNVAQTVCRQCGHVTIGACSRCPKCQGEDVEVWHRVVGYYRAVSAWNPGLQREFEKRHDWLR